MAKLVNDITAYFSRDIESVDRQPEQKRAKGNTLPVFPYALMRTRKVGNFRVRMRVYGWFTIVGYNFLITGLHNVDTPDVVPLYFKILGKPLLQYVLPVGNFCCR